MFMMAVQKRRAPHPALGRVIREARARKGWSREKLASEATISRNFVLSLEQGENVSADVLVRVANALELTTLPIGNFTAAVNAGGASTERLTSLLAQIHEGANEIGRILLVPGDHAVKGQATSDTRSDNVVQMPERRLTITLADQEHSDDLKEALRRARHSDVEFRIAYRDAPEKHVVKRKGPVAAGHGALAEISAVEKERQIPEHYYEERAAREVILMRGESLIDLGYVDRDLLFVRYPVDGDPKSDDVVVCSIGDEMLVKVYYADRKGRRWLLSANERAAESYPPRDVTNEPTFRVFGIVVGRSGYALPGSLAPRPQSK